MEKRNSIFSDILELLGNFIYVYDPNTDELNFYVVSNGREVLARKISNFKLWKDTFPEKYIHKNEAESFSRLCNDIANLNDISTNFHTDFFNNGNGDFQHFDIIGKKHVNPDGSECSVGYISALKQSVTDACRRTLGVELIKDAGVDVYNKKSIFEYCKHFMEENPGKQFYLAIFDLDNFKNVNDTFGHFYGDDVLVTTTEVLKDLTKDVGKVGRVGGDEFIVIFEQIDDREEMRLMLKNMRETIEASFRGKTGDFALTCSIGCALYPDCGNTFEEIYKVADAFLYLAKEKGRNRYILYREDLHKSLVKSVVNAEETGHVAQIYDAMSARWNASSIMDRIISEYYIKGALSLDELLEKVENRFFVDFIQVVGSDNKPVVERLNRCKTKSEKDIELVEFNDAFLEDMMGNNFFIANSLNSFHNPEAGGKLFMKRKKIQNAIFYKGENGGYVLLGKICDNRKWAEQDSLVLTTMAHLITLKMQ